MPGLTLALSRTALRVIALLALAVTPIDVDAQRPTMPRARREPCENYCNREWASCGRISLRTTPSEKAAIAAVVDSGLRVEVVDGERQTVAPGIIVVRRAFTLVEQRDSTGGLVTPKNAARWSLRAGDTIYVVDRISDGDGEASYVWFHRGREMTTDPFSPPNVYADPAPSDSLRLGRDIRQRWWRRVRTPDGKTGWTRSDDKWTGQSYYHDPVEKCAP
jgi:hypothetical protein